MNKGWGSGRVYDCTLNMLWEQHWIETAFSVLGGGAAMCHEG